jgi:molecular chaperone DnaK
MIVLDRNMNERIYPLIPEATPVPCEKAGRFAYAYDGMTAVRVEVTEGHGQTRDEVKVIGDVVLEDMPPRPRGTPIEVIYRYGLNQILEIDILDPDRKDHVRRARIDLRGGMSQPHLDAARKRMAAFQVS